MSLSISWLHANPQIGSFLNRHSAVVRVLGASPQREDKFIQAEESPERTPQAFRGIQALFASPFKIDSPNEFRGLKESPIDDDVVSERPPFAPPTEKSVSIQASDEEVEFNYVSRVIPEDDVIFKQNETLAGLLREDAELRDAFISGDYQDISEKLAQAAKSNLDWSPGITAQFLREHPDEALMIAADLGEITDLLVDSDTAEALTENVRERLENEIYNELATKVAGLMKNSTELDEEFFREHPRAALYLLERPDERRRIDGHVEAEKEFRQHVAGYEASVDPVVKAEEFAGYNVALGENFWQDNPDLALLLYADKVSGSDHSLQESALSFPVEHYETTTPAEMMAVDQARQASQLLGNQAPLDVNYLRQHSGLSRLINENPEFAARLKNDPDVGSLLATGDPEIMNVLRAYASGIPDRDESFWHWWA